jgi:hypothetical protein
MENGKKTPKQVAAEARKTRKKSDSNKRQRIRVPNSPAPASSSCPNTHPKPKFPLSNITPSNSNNNIDSNCSARLTQSNPVIIPNRFESPSQYQNQHYVSTPSNYQTSSTQSKTFYITDISVPIAQLGTKRKRADTMNKSGDQRETINSDCATQNTSNHTQQNDVVNINHPPPRQHHYQTRGVNLYNKFTAAINPNEASTSTPQIPTKQKSQYSHIFDNHCIDQSSSDDDSDEHSDSSESSQNESQTESDDDFENADDEQVQLEGFSNYKITPLFYFLIYKLYII